MTENAILALAYEIRADYQLPPYMDNEVIIRSINKCRTRLDSLMPGADFVEDELSRGYLKDFVYYDLHHRTEEFLQNYGPDIRAWQLSEEVPDATE